MRLCATVEIANTVGVVNKGQRYYQVQRPCKGILQLKKNMDGHVQIIISTNINMEAHVFWVRHIELILNTFIEEGKITIQMRQPQMNLMIRKANVKDLKAFLKAIHDSLPSMTKPETVTTAKVVVPAQTAASSRLVSTGLGNKSPQKRFSSRDIDGLQKNEHGQEPGNSKRIRLQSFENSHEVKRPPVTYDFTKSKPEAEKKTIKSMLREHENSRVLKVTKRENYPRDGLFRDLIEITTMGIRLSKIDIRMLPLKNLRVLNLSQNLITSIEPLKTLSSQLNSLLMNENSLERISDDFFMAPAFSKLKILSLSKNKLTVLPRSIVRLGNLKYLTASQNKLLALPYNMNLLFSLNRLSLDENNLTFLPRTLCRLRMTHLDISKNKFDRFLESDANIADGPTPSLLEKCADVIMTHNTSMLLRGESNKVMGMGQNELPSILVDVLESGKYCLRCGRTSLRYHIRRHIYEVGTLAETVVRDNFDPLPMKNIVCERCNLKS